MEVEHGLDDFQKMRCGALPLFRLDKCLQYLPFNDFIKFIKLNKHLNIDNHVSAKSVWYIFVYSVYIVSTI